MLKYHHAQILQQIAADRKVNVDQSPINETLPQKHKIC